MLKFLILLRIEWVTKVIYKNKAKGLQKYQFLRQGDLVKTKSGLIGRIYGISRKEGLYFQVNIKVKLKLGFNLLMDLFKTKKIRKSKALQCFNSPNI
jgi:preprotein translocase subunit YajC